MTSNKRTKTARDSIDSNQIAPVQPEVVQSQLAKLTKRSIASLAIGWTTTDNPTQQRQRRLQQQQGKKRRVSVVNSSDDEDEDGDGMDENEGLKEDYELLRDGIDPKAKVIKKVMTDWRHGFSFRQLAQIDIQLLIDKPTSKNWTAYQMEHDVANPTYSTPLKLSSRFKAAMSPYHTHHFYLDTTASPIVHILRLQLLPASSQSPLPSPQTFLHLPSTPYLLLPSVSSSLAPILLQCLASSMTTPSAKEVKPIQLSGKDFGGLVSMLKGIMSSGGMAKWKKGRGEGGGPLVPKTRRRLVDDSKGKKYVEEQEEGDIVMDDGHMKQDRDTEVGLVFGREDLPVIERLDYEIKLPYPSSENATPDDEEPPFLLRFEGSNVLEGLRVANENGFVDDGLPPWLGMVGEEGRNTLQIGVDGVVR